jgi:sugar-specific transcriptional regulator TrmB
MEESLKILEKLGLSGTEARIYIALINSQKTTAQKLAKNINIDRSDSYKNLVKLRNKGFVEEEVSKPKRYSAIPFEKVISNLVEKKKTECAKVEQMAGEFLKKYDMIEKNAHAIEDESTFLILTRTDEDSPNRVKELWENSKESIDIFWEEEPFFETLRIKFHYYYNALQKGIKIRVLLIKSPKIKKSARTLRNMNILLKYSNFELRYSLVTDLAAFSCFDTKRAWIPVGAREILGARFPILFINDVNLVKLLCNLFTRLWKEGK